MDGSDIFELSIRSQNELRELVGTPHQAVVKKSVAQLDERTQDFISMSPLVFISTSSAEGKCDVSPRGDQPGFVHILDERRLMIPEKPGNRRGDSMFNILSNPHAGLLFLIPGLHEVLRINGRACVVKTADVMPKWPANQEPPLLSVVVEVEECFIHCSRALNKSQIWDVDTWPSKENLPSAAEMFQAHLKINGYTLKE
ncbi:pyridoxamine 5'-phosphate oxidase family protein [Paenibacillus validus]|uniref:Pyridoxamine 5'-phosphate oxidase family protein n=1 Tax=Paenibacillus validus TaxID=44253 RepID=A0A7X2ZCL8_9BACL|nr:MULTISPECIES: MSMEG_1061 family FMN-dependent PPOX-type flavoprotein [Paenibacillus]MED4600640.1 pyridoxamine 5'-phosphate oxidase family protein [Paenibacillus validus]MED4605279.1 pyridoxamine 5'-phosphate oxidase family protein [Paenibacillus validus]MUG71825.1 pyridoxamine 5'-phosphate oxidase family protein [Paenibacillus validus]